MNFFANTKLAVCLTILFALFSPDFSQGQEDTKHASTNATSQFDLHPELDVELFAAEPMMANPTNIDVDHLGRIWVCEVLNYRHFRNKDATPREAGDRILILEDTNGDAVADKSTVFYQGKDIDSAHGICVLGDRAIVSANDSVFFLIDTDGDLKADKKEILFTGISGTQHDHGIHAFVFGPDGKLYFNFGNAGKQIKDKNGNPITDMAGNVVNDKRKPYNQGMIFRCNMDGSQFETLAWNFRNNWEVCVDSFGSLWQSDNDDDGNKATRINFVIPFGNYGYTDQVTGSGWRTPRTNMHPDIPTRHWYQNDPGVIPNLIGTGAGSPTGICVYEGDALPDVFKNQVIHCDAGPSIVRAYPVKKDGAGYTAKIVNMMDGAKKNQWFRPSDVCVAPDGSLIVADWYDPGVGGHRMQDVDRGRLFRLAKKGQSGSYGFAKPDFSSPESAAMALKSPNHETRYLAWSALNKFGANSIPALEKLWADTNPRMAARAMWVLGKLKIPKADKLKFIHEGLQHENPDLRVMSLRLCVQLKGELELADIQDQINSEDLAPEVLREILIGLRQWPGEHLPFVWADVADGYISGDRWFLEALGIAAEGHWDQCVEAWVGTNPNKLLTNEGRDIVWRSKSTKTPELLAKIIADKKTAIKDSGRYFRAFDLLVGDSKTATAKSEALKHLAFEVTGLEKEKAIYVTMEAASRIDTKSLNPDQMERVSTMIDDARGSAQFIELINKFSSEKHYPELLKIASQGKDRQQAADAMGVLMTRKWMGPVHGALVAASPEQRVTLCDSLVNCGQRNACFILSGVGKRQELDSELRTYAIKRLGEIQAGRGDMLWWIDQGEKIDPVIMPAIKAALHNSKDPNTREKAQELFPIAKSKDNRPMPPIADLSKRPGNIENGKKVFENAGTCAKCHVVNGKGIEVGPDLSEIGSKLTKPAMYESILFPSAGISHNYENWMVLKEDGQSITGVLLSETESEVQLKDDKGIKHVIPVAQIDEKAKQKLSLMPADLHKELTQKDLVDLVEYMLSLKKKQ